ncbi:hypothetical protein TELCIR_20930, partial [Teladorsagia circumcincta]
IPLLDYLNGAAFLKINGPTYLNVVSMSSELMEEFPVVQKILILYQDKVLYYSLSRRDLPSLFRYLTQSLLPMTIGDELDYQSRSTQGRFLRGPSDLSTDAPLVGDDALPTVHLFNAVDDDDNEELVKYNMVGNQRVPGEAEVTIIFQVTTSDGVSLLKCYGLHVHESRGYQIAVEKY